MRLEHLAFCCRSARHAAARHTAATHCIRPPFPLLGNSYNFVPTLSLNVIKTFLEGTVLPTLASAESTYNTVKAAE